MTDRINIDNLIIRKMEEKDIVPLKDNFHDSISLYSGYYQEQLEEKRTVLVAEYARKVVGYVTLVHEMTTGPFAGRGIPEIKDFNVLPEYRRQRIGTALMDVIEEVGAYLSMVIGIGVGLYEDYGAAQKMYVRRGYIPDATGIWYGDNKVKPGESYPIDDDLALYFTKFVDDSKVTTSHSYFAISTVIDLIEEDNLSRTVVSKEGLFIAKEIEEKLGLPTYLLHSYNEKTALGNEYGTSFYSCLEQREPVMDMEIQVEAIVEALKSKRDELNQIKEQYDVSYSIYLAAFIHGEETPNITFSKEVIDFCSEIGIELDVNIYNFDKEER